MGKVDTVFRPRDFFPLHIFLAWDGSFPNNGGSSCCSWHEAFTFFFGAVDGLDMCTAEHSPWWPCVTNAYGKGNIPHQITKWNFQIWTSKAGHTFSAIFICSYERRFDEGLGINYPWNVWVISELPSESSWAVNFRTYILSATIYQYTQATRH